MTPTDTGSAALPPLAELASQVASLLALGLKSDSVSLDPKSLGNAAISAYLQHAFATPLKAVAAGLPDDSSKTLMLAMIDQIAALQADNLVLKAFFLDDPLKNRIWDVRYQDPLTVLRDMVADEASAARSDTPVDMVVHLNPKVLGAGWHKAEQGAGDSWWRWSGPDARCSLILPAYGAGLYQFSATLSLLSSEKSGTPRIYVNYHPVENFEIYALDADRHQVSFTATLPESLLSSYIVLEIELDRTVSPAEIEPGSLDPRLLGVGLGSIRISRTPPPVVVPNLPDPSDRGAPVSGQPVLADQPVVTAADR